MEQVSKNITRQGLTNYTLNFLRVGVTVFGLGLGLEAKAGSLHDENAVQHS